MHKQILRTAVAVAVTGSVAQAAYAQSSVTLYGIVDAGFTYTNNQKGNSAYSYCVKKQQFLLCFIL